MYIFDDINLKTIEDYLKELDLKIKKMELEKSQSDLLKKSKDLKTLIQKNLQIINGIQNKNIERQKEIEELENRLSELTNPKYIQDIPKINQKKELISKARNDNMKGEEKIKESFLQILKKIDEFEEFEFNSPISFASVNPSTTPVVPAPVAPVVPAPVAPVVPAPVAPVVPAKPSLQVLPMLKQIPTINPLILKDIEDCGITDEIVIQKTSGDGNCLFHAFLANLKRLGLDNGINNDELRQKNIKWLKNNLTTKINGTTLQELIGNECFEIFDPNLIDRYNKENILIEKYLEEMSKDGTWGSQLNAITMGLEYNVNVVIFSRGINNIYKPTFSGNWCYDGVWLLHAGSHYSSLIPPKNVIRDIKYKNPNNLVKNLELERVGDTLINLTRKPISQSINQTEKIKEFIRNVPKTELHIHLEATVPPSILIKQGIIPQIDISLTGNLFDKFNIYLKKIKEYIIKDTEDMGKREINFKKVMKILFDYIFEDRLKQNIMFTQFQYSGLKMHGINFNSYNEPETGLTLLQQARMMTEVIDTIKQNPKYKPVFIEFILEIPRGQALEFKNYTMKKYIEDINILLNQNNKYFKGVGLGGRSEDNPYNFRKFSEELLRVRRNKVPGIINPHAGEFGTTPMNLIETIESEPERIGHGIQIINFNDTSNQLIQKSISYKYPISYDVCITSNIKFIPHMNLTYPTHPIYEMLKQKLHVNLSTDDPILLGKDMESPLTLIEEYENFVFNGGWDDKQKIQNLIKLVKNGWKSNGVNNFARDKYLPILEKMAAELVP
jgi:adenosine deaminase